MMYTRFHPKRRLMFYILSVMMLDTDIFKTYIFEHFKKIVDDFIKNDRITHNDSNFIDKSNVLDLVSDELSGYYIQLYLIDTLQFKRISAEFKKKNNRR